eukprot:CAMPEP_0177599238 /NCGR_PEP_ID=MMETSP0419_2-20121207/12864_1 /TAXON_ID=582737 /ORGANISM="Tetraselmis sp., Strain GSL018" /LENGTH=115 /DNA_ID=CAMNT_0019091913 /DNA_START=63 /DNA_END=411 /DNA_ORIENTATION=-
MPRGAYDKRYQTTEVALLLDDLEAGGGCEAPHVLVPLAAAPHPADHLRRRILVDGKGGEGAPRVCKQQDTPAGPQHAGHLAQGLERVWVDAEAERVDDSVEGTVSKREALNVRLL